MSNETESQSSVDPAMQAPVKDASAARRWTWFAVKWVVLLLLLVLLGRHVTSLWHDWKTSQAGTKMRPAWGWLGASALAYAGAQLMFACFWSRMLGGVGITSRFSSIAGSYTFGTLGKYIPGKAAVIIFRSSALKALGYRGEGVGRLAMAISVLAETLSSMAFAGLFAAVCIVLSAPGRWLAWLGGLGIGCGLLLALSPPVFRRLTGMVSRPFVARGVRPVSLEPLRPALRGAWLLALGWLLSGASFWLVGLSLGAVEASLGDLVASVGVTALATSAGFLAIFAPSGLAVRELIIIYTFGARWGEHPVVLLALLLRMTWTLTEVILAGAVYFLAVRPRRRTDPAAVATHGGAESL